MIAARACASIALALAVPAVAAARPFNSFDGTSGNFGNDRVPAGRFADRFTFTIAADGEFSATIYSANVRAGGELDLSAAQLTGPGGIDLAFSVASTGAEEYRVFTPQVLSPGTYTLRVHGRSGGAARYDGQVQFVQIGRLPEPATWVMMLLGFGSLGFVVRRRRPGTSRIRFH